MAEGGGQGFGARLGLGIDLQEHRFGRACQIAVVVDRAKAAVVAGYELVVHWFLVHRRGTLHPRVKRGLLNANGRRLGDGHTAVVQGQRHGQRPTALGAQQR